jgi:hypothetical protein
MNSHTTTQPTYINIPAFVNDEILGEAASRALVALGDMICEVMKDHHQYYDEVSRLHGIAEVALREQYSMLPVNQQASFKALMLDIMLTLDLISFNRDDQTNDNDELEYVELHHYVTTMYSRITKSKDSINNYKKLLINYLLLKIKLGRIKSFKIDASEFSSHISPLEHDVKILNTILGGLEIIEGCRLREYEFGIKELTQKVEELICRLSLLPDAIYKITYASALLEEYLSENKKSRLYKDGDDFFTKAVSGIISTILEDSFLDKDTFISDKKKRINTVCQHITCLISDADYLYHDFMDGVASISSEVADICSVVKGIYENPVSDNDYKLVMMKRHLTGACSDRINVLMDTDKECAAMVLLEVTTKFNDTYHAPETKSHDQPPIHLPPKMTDEMMFGKEAGEVLKMLNRKMADITVKNKENLEKAFQLRRKLLSDSEGREYFDLPGYQQGVLEILLKHIAQSLAIIVPDSPSRYEKEDHTFVEIKNIINGLHHHILDSSHDAVFKKSITEYVLILSRVAMMRNVEIDLSGLKNLVHPYKYFISTVEILLNHLHKFDRCRANKSEDIGIGDLCQKLDELGLRFHILSIVIEETAKASSVMEKCIPDCCTLDVVTCDKQETFTREVITKIITLILESPMSDRDAFPSCMMEAIKNILEQPVTVADDRCEEAISLLNACSDSEGSLAVSESDDVPVSQNHPYDDLYRDFMSELDTGAYTTNIFNKLKAELGKIHINEYKDPEDKIRSMWREIQAVCDNLRNCMVVHKHDMRLLEALNHFLKRRPGVDTGYQKLEVALQEKRSCRL